MISHGKLDKYIQEIENNIHGWSWVRGNTRFYISRVEHDISLDRAKNLVFPSTHVFFCLLYKGHAVFEKR